MTQKPDQGTSSTNNPFEPISEELISESLLQEELLAEEETRMLRGKQVSPAEMAQNTSASSNLTGDNGHKTKETKPEDEPA